MLIDRRSASHLVWGHDPLISPRKEVVGEIAPEVLRKQTVKGWFRDSETPFFQAPVRADFDEAIRKAEPGIKDEEVRRRYNRAYFNTMWGKKQTEPK